MDAVYAANITFGPLMRSEAGEIIKNPKMVIRMASILEGINFSPIRNLLDRTAVTFITEPSSF